MQIDPFFQVPLHTHSTSAGEVQLPLLFKEADAAITLFRCDRNRVEKQLEGTGLQPALVLGRHALVSICLYNMVHTNIGSYCIALLAVPVHRQRGFRPISPWRELFEPADKRHMGFYMLSAMTSSPMCAVSGRELWGFPKHLGQVDFNLQGSALHCRAYNGPQTLMELSGTGFPLCRVKHLDFNLFSILQDYLIRTLLVTRGKFHARFPLGYRLRVGPVPHPFCDQLRALDLDGRHPLLLISSSDYQARMQEGVAVESLPATEPLPHRQQTQLVV